MLKNNLLPVFLLLFGFANSKVQALTFGIVRLKEIVATFGNEDKDGQCLELFKLFFLKHNLPEIQGYAGTQSSGSRKGDSGRYDQTRPICNFAFYMAKDIIPNISIANPVMITSTGTKFTLLEVAKYCRIITYKVLAKLNELDSDGLSGGTDCTAILGAEDLGLDVYDGTTPIDATQTIIDTGADDDEDDDATLPPTQQAVENLSQEEQLRVKKPRPELSLCPSSLSSISSSSNPPSSMSSMSSSRSACPSLSFSPGAGSSRAPQPAKKAKENAWDKRRKAATKESAREVEKGAQRTISSFFSSTPR